MFGKNLKKLRKQNKLTQEDLARHLAVSRQAVCMWERGARTPKVSLLTKIAGIFAVPLDYIIHRKSIFHNDNPGSDEKLEEIPEEILVVDDEKGMRDLLTKALSKEGYIVHTAEDGETAIMMLKESLKKKIALVLLDIKLPGINGIGTLRQVKKIRKDLPIIMISAYATHLTAIETKILGAYKCLRKPFTMERLKGVVKKALKGIENNKNNTSE